MPSSDNNTSTKRRSTLMSSMKETLIFDHKKKKKRIPTDEEIDAFIFIGLTGSMIAYPILMFIFLMVVVGPKG